MKQKEKREMFKQFLKDNDCYKKFKIELMRQGKIKINIFYKLYKANPALLLECAFNWEFTNQGENYWSSINEKWRDLLYATR